jgi:kynurenine 3-monooxygenase
MRSPGHTDVAIAGGGLGGTLMALYLARRGLRVHVFERRPDVRREMIDSGRSINMTIAERGLWALEPVGLRDAVTRITMPLRGRLTHAEDGSTQFQRYGRAAGEVHRSIKRSELNALLLDAVEALPGVQLAFHTRYLRGGKSAGPLVVQDVRTGETRQVAAGVLIGADGAHSAVRADMHRDEVAEFEERSLPEGYKELTIPAGRNGSFRLDPETVHVWPRGSCVLIAIANRDGSFSCTCTMPFDGPIGFAGLASREQAAHFFERHFGDVLDVAPEIVDEFMSRTAGRYTTTMTAPWHYGNRIVLLGDACHSVLPFYAQGMNATFEDCRTLDECLTRSLGDFEAAFIDYESRRRRHTDALARLSKQNYIELKEKIRSPMFQARRQVDLTLERWSPGRFATLYSLISHTTVPYAEALERCERRAWWLKWTGLDALLTLAAMPRAAAAIVRAWTRSLARAWRAPQRDLAGAGSRRSETARLSGRRPVSEDPHVESHTAR